VYGQATIDFETVGQNFHWTHFSNADGDSTLVALVDNPSKTGINTSAKCMKFTVKKLADSWAGIFTSDAAPVTLTADNSMITVMVYKDTISNFNLKLEPPAKDHKVMNTVINQWEKLTFDYTANAGVTATVITVIPDGRSVRSANCVVYFDNIEFIHTPVPVEFTSFSASVIKDGIQLSWSTATETNNKGFEVLRGIDSKAYNTIGFVNGKGTTTANQQYSYVDATAKSGKYYYRLRQVDFDGTSKFSKVIEAGGTIPAVFELSQNFPNPFNPVTNIRYAITNPERVTLKVFNILGKEVAVLVNENKEAGTYSVDFSALNLASGTYIYRLQAGAFVQTKKMVVLK